MKTAGEYLKKVREEKKITIQEVIEGTNMVKRHIIALEESNFNLFPGETYVQGFLRTYATFLGADPEYTFQLYKGTILEETETPLKELTEPAVRTSDYIIKYFKILFIPILLIITVFLLYLLFHEKDSNFIRNRKTNTHNNIQVTKQNLIPKIETDNIKLKRGYSTALIRKNKGINFSINDKGIFAEVYLVLKKIQYKTDTDSVSSALLDLYPGKKEIKLIENKAFEIQQEGLPRKFKITLLGATMNAIRIQIDQGEKIKIENKIEKRTGPSNADNFIIIFEGFAERATYVEFYVDGKMRKKGLIAQGSQLHFEANDSIQMKLGDPRALKITINGKAYSFGKNGQAISKVIRKRKDPIEQTKYIIDIK